MDPMSAAWLATPSHFGTARLCSDSILQANAPLLKKIFSRFFPNAIKLGNRPYAVYFFLDSFLGQCQMPPSYPSTVWSSSQVDAAQYFFPFLWLSPFQKTQYSMESPRIGLSWPLHQKTFRSLWQSISLISPRDHTQWTATNAEFDVLVNSARSKHTWVPSHP
jgi:hypothetical protein